MSEQPPLPEGTKNLPTDRDMTLCPFGCGSAAKHNDHCYSWQCGSNSLRYARGNVGAPIHNDLVQTSTCKRFTDLTAQLAAERERAENAEMERDEAKAQHDAFRSTVDEWSERVEGKLNTALPGIRSLAAKLAAAEEREAAMREAAAPVVRWYFEDCVSSTWPGDTREEFERLKAALLSPAAGQEDGDGR